MILITGATGHLGTATINALLQKGVDANQISALARDDSKAANLKAKGINIVTGNYDDYTSLVAAFKNVDKLFFVSGNDVANRNGQHYNVVNAAKEAGVKHVVYTSYSRKNETETSALWVIGQSHLATEKWLKESGLTYTILKNNLYADYVPFFIGEKVLETGTIYFPAGKGKASLVSRVEMGEAAASVLASSGHENKTYDITNTETYSYDDIAKYITEISGKEIKYISPNVKEYEQAIRNAGVPDLFIGFFLAFASATEQGDLSIVSNDLQNLIGRKPTTLKEFLKAVYSES